MQPTRLIPLLAAALICALSFSAVAAKKTAPPALAYTIAGLDNTLAENLRLHLGTLDPQLGAQPDRLEGIVRRALGAALQPYGFYEAEVKLEMDPSPQAWRFTVTPGQRIVYAPDSRVELDAIAQAVPAIATVLKRAPFTAGKGLSHPEYDAWRDELLRTCRQNGFLQARYSLRELRIDRARHEARALLAIEAGTRFRFDSIEVSGTRLEASLLETLKPWDPGEYFDAQKLRRFERRLRDTGYFRSVAVTAKRVDSDRVHVNVLAEDLLTSRYDIGAGFSTDSNLRLRFNRSSPQFNDSGHSLLIESEFSEPRQALTATLRIPHKDPLDDVFELYSTLLGENIEDTDSLRSSTGVRHTLRLAHDWTWSQGLGIEIERYTLGSESEKHVSYLMPATSLQKTKIDAGLDPLNGYSIWTALDGSHTSLHAPTDFLRWRGRFRLLYGLPDDNTTVLTRVDLGGIWTDGFNQIPASLRFDAGGDQSIRGYDIDSLGPRDVNGKLLGGRYLTVGSIEISRRVLPRWRLALFVDGGGAFTERNDDFYQSVGIGVRWLSPIGQLRADIGVPIGDEEADGIKLHISMGPPL